MKKLIITEAQYKMLQNEGLEYTPEKIDEFVIDAKSAVAKGLQLVQNFINVMAATTIGEIMDDEQKYKGLMEKGEKYQKHYETMYNRYYDVVNMYDYMDDDFPKNVTELDKQINELDRIQGDLYEIYNSIEEVIDVAHKFKKHRTEDQDVNEQLFKGIKDKVTQIKDKVVNAVNPKKEISVPGNPPSKGRDMDQLRNEWSKINAKTDDLRGYGEFVSPDESIARSGAQTRAKAAIMKKLNRTEASFGVEIMDQALFKLENGNYFQMIIVEANNVK